MNILVTSIGSFSAPATIESLRKSGRFDTIVGCDIYPSVWHNVSKNFDDVFIAPRVNESEKYFQFIKHVCDQCDINIIVPLTDVEVDFFNDHREYFINNDIVITIGSPFFLNIARNKRILNDFCNKIDGLTPISSYSFGELSIKSKFPLIAKPVNGRSSEGIYFVESLDHLKKDLRNTDYIYQEIIEGKICTVDYVRSSKFNSDFCIPRWEHLRTKNGAGMTVEIFHSQLIDNIVSKIGRDFDINGCVNFEFIINKEKIHLIDINPRFSAGIGFSILSGYNFIESHINCFINENILQRVEFNNIIAEKVMSDVINMQIC